MAFYGRQHYERVSQPPDTTEAIRDRKIQARASALAIADREHKYPVLTGDNANEAIQYQEERIKYHARILGR